MSNTARQNILANIKTTLEGISSIKTVLVNKLSIPDLNTYARPICFVFSGDEIKETANDVLMYESWIWPIFVEVWALDTDMETYLGLIHNAMGTDETRGGYAISCERRTASAPWLLDADDNLSGMLIEFEVKYRHVYFNM